MIIIGLVKLGHERPIPRRGGHNNLFTYFSIYDIKSEIIKTLKVYRTVLCVNNVAMNIFNALIFINCSWIKKTLKFSDH